MDQMDYQALSKLLASPQRIAIIPHRSPDGDAMGSCLALYHYLTKRNHDCQVISPNEFPDFLAWLPASEKVLVFEKQTQQATEVLESADIVFTLDFNALHRTGEMEHTLARLSGVFVMIDHHQKPDAYADYMFSDPSYGSTCEMMYNFIENMGDIGMLDKTIATCIYTGIVTDSGSFRYPTTTSRTHHIAAHLIDLGVDNGYVHFSIFDNHSLQRMQLLARSISHLQVVQSGKISFSYLSHEDLEEFQYRKGDTEGIVNYGLSIKGVVFTALFTEHRDENIVKISFRSTGQFDVNEFAREHFNGGGHINAAGGKSMTTLSETLRKFEGIVSQLTL